MSCNVNAMGNIQRQDQRQERLKAHLRAIYAKAYENITIEKILDSYEEYVDWCLSKNVTPKDLLGFAVNGGRHYGEPVVNMIKDFLREFNED